MSDKFEIQATGNGNPEEAIKELNKFMKNMNVKILVGFPSGREHVEMLHKEHRRADGTEYGKYVGYHGEDPATHKPIETSELAKMLSFGAHGVPARPFLEEGMQAGQKDIAQALGQEMATVLAGGSANWNKIGAVAVGKIQEFVRGDYYKTHVPNSQKTIDYKGSDTPLIDGADLINSLEFEVDKT